MFRSCPFGALLIFDGKSVTGLHQAKSAEEILAPNGAAVLPETSQGSGVTLAALA